MQLYSELLDRNIDFQEKESSPHEILDHVIRYETDAEFDFEPFICDNARVSVRCRIWDKTGREVRGFGEAAEANLRNPIAKSYPIKMAIKRAFDDAAVYYLGLPAKDYKLLLEMEEQQSNKPTDEKIGDPAEKVREKATQPAQEQRKPVTNYEDVIITIGRQKGKNYTVAQLAEKDMDSLLYIANTFPRQISPISGPRQEQVDACQRWLKEHSHTAGKNVA